jgi:hypothetical protein
MQNQHIKYFIHRCTKLLLAFLFCFTFYAANAQYFQQEVNYSIDVELNDTLHTLTGFVSIDYKNNSPYTLNEIWMHLWPNAYKNTNTKFAKQMLENGNTSFQFSKDYHKGFIRKIAFRVNAETVKWELDTPNIDIAKITLNKPLKPGESINITTPFMVRVPKTFSRLGHEGQSYQISQWYPKPAVFDKDGWHPLSYLDQGEFYSEFGSFEVRITLPKNYIVGATGELQTTEEHLWMDSLIAEHVNDTTLKKTKRRRSTFDKFPESSAEKKTIEFKQDKIHDFAWFADKRYLIRRDTVQLPKSQRKVLCTTMFTPSSKVLWRNSTDYLKDAILHYSEKVGEYPYNVVSAVEGALEAGGGMEYPTITVIGKTRNKESLDEVITHEVGHNWFYGILASNERINPWMDEGVNSYYERAYMSKKYPNSKLLGGIFNSGLGKLLDMKKWKASDMNYLIYLIQARENRDQKATLRAEEFTNDNMGIIVYLKTALLLDYLKNYLGESRYDSCMHTYFNEWKFKHPQPSDFRTVFENTSGENLSWWFDSLLNTTKKIDVKIKKATVENDSITSITYKKNYNFIPVLPSAILKGKIVNDTSWSSPDINRKNNFYYYKKAAKRSAPLRLQFITSIENPERTQICFAPWIGANHYDKFFAGLAFYSPLLPAQKFKYLIAPAYSIKGKTIVGGFRMSYNFYPEEGGIQHLAFGINGKRYSYWLDPKPMQFNKIEPTVSIEIKKKHARSPNTHFIKLRSTNIWLDYEYKQGKSTISKTQHYYVNEAAYRFERKTTLHPLDVQVSFQQSDYFLQMRAEANFRISYKKKNKGFDIRVFAGGNPLYFKAANDISAPLGRLYLSMNTLPNSIYWLQRDYMFDETFMNRNGNDQYISRSVTPSQGAFRSLTTFGATRNFLMSANFSSQLPIPIPIYPWASTAVIYNEQNKFEFAAELGVSVGLKDVLELHIPFATTKNIRDNQELFGFKRFFQRISFTARIKLGDPLALIRRFVG